MFKAFISKLRSVCRLDTVTSTKDVKIGEVLNNEGESQLALQVPSGEVLTLEERAERQLVSGQYGIPHEHFARLPRQLQCEELTHFMQNSPREITIRAIRQDEQAYPAARAVVSGKYQPYDSHEVLEAAEPLLEGWNVSHASVGRDEMTIHASMPQALDVGSRQVNDVVRAGLMISNSEVGTMALRIEFSLFRLKCLNGLVLGERVAAAQRHIWIDKAGFQAKIRDAVAQAGVEGQAMARLLRNARTLALPNLKPEEGRLQREVVRVLTREGLWTRQFEKDAAEALGGSETADLFGLVQFLTDRFAKDAPIAERLHRERVAGRLLQIANHA